MTNLEDKDLKWYTEFVKTQNQIGMVIRKKNGTDYIDAAAIALSINESTGDTTALIKADHVNISATNTAQLLSGAMMMDASANLVIKEGAGLYVQHTSGGSVAKFGVWDDGNITSGIIVSKINGTTSTVIKADYIDIDGIVSELSAYDIQCDSIYCTTESTFDGGIYTTDISGSGAYFDEGSITDFDCTDLNGHTVSWKSQQVITDMSTSGNYATWAKTDSSHSSVTGGAYQKMITDISLTTKTLNYLSY